MRRAMVHPKMARHVANHIIEKVWRQEATEFEQVQPGVFTSDEEGLVITGAAQMSEPATTALRVTGRLWELLVVMYPTGAPIVYGPRHLYDEAEWGSIVGNAVALTQDVQCVLTTFEVAPVRNEQEAADIAGVSAVVGQAFSADTTPDEELLSELLHQIDLEVAS